MQITLNQYINLHFNPCTHFSWGMKHKSSVDILTYPNHAHNHSPQENWILYEYFIHYQSEDLFHEPFDFPYPKIHLDPLVERVQ